MNAFINPVRSKRGTLEPIAKAFHCTTACVSQHLSGHTNNATSQQMRKMALELGGSEYLPRYNESHKS